MCLVPTVTLRVGLTAAADVPLGSAWVSRPAFHRIRNRWRIYSLRVDKEALMATYFREQEAAEADEIARINAALPFAEPIALADDDD